MGRAPCCDKANVKKGPWSPEEDTKLKEYIDNFGTGGNWIALPHKAGLKRCGKSCRLRWLNYLRPDLKHGQFSDDEDRIICSLFASIGSRWSIIAAQLPGRTDNDIKNYWNTKLKKKFMEIFPSSHTKSIPPIFSSFQNAPTYQNNMNYHPLSKSLNGLEPLSFPSNLFNTSTSSTLLEPRESLIGFRHHYDHQERDNFLVFGTGEPSCSSSDGSGNQISANSVQIGQEGYLTNGGHRDQKFMLGSSTCVGWPERTNGFLVETPLPIDYNCSSTSDQEIKTQSRVMYF